MFAISTHPKGPWVTYNAIWLDLWICFLGAGGGGTKSYLTLPPTISGTLPHLPSVRGRKGSPSFLGWNPLPKIK